MIKPLLLFVALIAALTLLLLAVNPKSSSERDIESHLPEPSMPVITEPGHEPNNDSQDNQTQTIERYSFLREPLANLCTHLDQVTPSEEITDKTLKEQTPFFLRELEELTTALSTSPETESLHAASYLESDPNVRIKLLNKAIQKTPNDTHLLWTSVQLCSAKNQPTDCPLKEWEKKLLSLDHQNSEAWIQAAANRYKEGDNSAALSALKRAASSAETHTYFLETVELFERVITENAAFSNFEYAHVPIGFASTHMPNYSNYTKMCSKQSLSNNDWAHACLAYGETASTQSKTEMGVRIAYAIQKQALDVLGRHEDALNLENEIKERRRLFRPSESNSANLFEQLLLFDKKLRSEFFSTMRVNGELAARRLFIDEFERLIVEQPGLDCSSLTPVYAPKN